MTTSDENRRQVLYWGMRGRLFDADEQLSLESASVAIVDDLGLPPALLDPEVSVDTLVQRHPELADEFAGLMAPDEDAATGQEVRRAALVSKLLINVFGT